MNDPYVERTHSNGAAARVTYFPTRQVYQASMWPPLHHGHVVVGEGRTDLTGFDAACKAADLLAHVDCDGRCPPWPPDPKSEAPPRTWGKACPKCGSQMTFSYSGRNSSAIQNPWVCTNPECVEASSL